MIPLQSRPKMAGASSRLSVKRRKRFSGRTLIGVGVIFALVLLAASAAFALQTLAISHAASYSRYDRHNHAIATINGLAKITQIGSTATILNTQGKQVTVDPNPYKIAIAPSNLFPGFRAGDIVVSDIGNNDKGITLVKFSAQKGPGRLFNTMPDGVLGPAGLAFEQGKLLVANSTGNSVLVFNPNGTLFATLKSPLFNGPWGITPGSVTSEGRNQLISFFTANKFDAKILRVDVLVSNRSMLRFRVTQVGQFTKNGTLTKIDLHWLPALRVGNRTWQDVLLAIDPANNRVAAFAHSSLLHGTGKGLTIFQGKPLNQPGGLGINPLNGDLLIVNLMDNNLVELNPTSGKVIGVKQIDPAKVDNQGNGSALFGVVGVKDQRGNLRVFFTDDNTNTLDVLSAS